MSVTDDLLRNAAAYANVFERGRLPRPPAMKLAVVTCMDSRINPFSLLNLREGDAHMIRNAGGIITDEEIRSLASYVQGLHARAPTAQATAAR